MAEHSQPGELGATDDELQVAPLFEDASLVREWSALPRELLEVRYSRWYRPPFGSASGLFRCAWRITHLSPGLLPALVLLMMIRLHCEFGIHAGHGPFAKLNEDL